MKTLFLGRHAKSSWDHPDLTDYERPLNDRGERNAPDTGRRLAAKYPPPDLIVSSSAVRARTTAAILAKEWGYEREVILETSLYEATQSSMLDRINLFGEDVASALIVAHNPTTTWLATSLANVSIPNVPTCGIVALRIPCETWGELEIGGAELIEFDYPKKKPEA